VYYSMFLCDVHKLPIHQYLPGSVVYTAHAYSWFTLKYTDKLRDFLPFAWRTRFGFSLL